MNTARLVILVAGTLLGAAFLAPSPAAAQSAPQSTEVPWYMPQPWMAPPSTAPRVASRPGQYGHATHNRSSYGSFSNGCYGKCGQRFGTVVTGNGVVLFRPRVVILDPRAFAVVPRGTMIVTQGGFFVRQGFGGQRQVVVGRLPQTFGNQTFGNRTQAIVPSLKGKSTPMIARQNGVRIFTPNPSY